MSFRRPARVWHGLPTGKPQLVSGERAGTRPAKSIGMNEMHVSMLKLLSATLALSMGVGLTFGSALAALVVALR